MALDKARVLIVDNDARVRQLLKEVLDQEGYSVQITEGTGQKLVENALNLAGSFRPHAAIVDLRIGGSPNLDAIRVGDKGGLEILRALPNTLCILRSSYLTPGLVVKAIHEYKAFDVIDSAAPPQQLLDAVKRAVQQKNAASREFEVKWLSAWHEDRVIQTLFSEEKDIPANIVSDVLSQLFPDSNKVTLGPLEKSVTTPGAVIRGRSVVLKARIDNKLEPLIVKLGPAHRIRAEAEKYHEYIEGNLGGNFHASLVKEPVIFWKLGGLLYKFLGGDLREIRLFAEFYREQGDAEIIIKPLSHFFETVWFNHYKKTNDLDLSLFDSYDKVLRLKDRLNNLPSGDILPELPNIAVLLPNPAPWVLRHSDDSRRHESRQVIAHGDLHGGNIFVQGQHSWIIDFERTGPGHILQDFVEMEVDIITRLTSYPKNDFSLLFELAIFLTKSLKPRQKKLKEWPRLQGNPDITKAVRVVTKLRKLARKLTHTQDNDLQEYIWGLLFDALFVAAMSDKPYEKIQRDRALLYSAVLCHRLQNLDGPWPPADWPRPVKFATKKIARETSRKKDVEQLIKNHHRRLQILLEKAASAGATVDPWILIEIEDIKVKIEKLHTELKSL